MDFSRCYGCMEELAVSGGFCPRCGYDNTNDPKRQPTQALSCGTVLNGRYVIGKVLGQGGFGITYLAFNLALELRVCIKEYFPSGAALRSTGRSGAVSWGGGESAETLRQGRESFVKEARKAVKLRRLDSVVKVWDVFYENETAYLVMDYVEGEALSAWLKKGGRPLGEDECIRLFSPVMEDLTRIHEAGIIHRDIKPDNLMVQPDGSLVLLDFGAAKDLSGGSGQSSFMVASQGFSPIEQYRRKGQIGPWTDVYALCATIVYCCSGKLLPEPMDRVSGEEMDLSAFSPAVRAVLEQGLALQPGERIQSMEELSAKLNAALGAAAETARAERLRQEKAAEEERRQREKAAREEQKRREAQAREEERRQREAEREKEKRRKEAEREAKKQQAKARPAAEPKPPAGPQPEGGRTKGKRPLLLVIAALLIAAGIGGGRVISLENRYKEAVTLAEAGQYEEAIAAFTALGNYKDAPEQAEDAAQRKALEEQYQSAAALAEAGQLREAALSYGSLGDYKDAREQSFGLWEQIAPRESLAAGRWHTVGLKADGTVVAAGRNNHGQCDVSDWRDIVAVDADSTHTVGLKADGTVVAVGRNDEGQCEVSGWRDIVAVAAGTDHTVGLKADGTVIAVGRNNVGQCEVSGWRDIVAVAAGSAHTVGLKADGTVVAVGRNNVRQCEVSGWRDIVAVAAGASHTVGLRADGTVVAVGINYDGRCDVSAWRGIVAVAAGTEHTVGLKADGTVVAVGWNDDGRCDVSGWRDIVAVAAGTDHTVGLKADGTVIAVGGNTFEQCDVSGWKNIKQPNKR